MEESMGYSSTGILLENEGLVSNLECCGEFLRAKLCALENNLAKITGYVIGDGLELESRIACKTGFNIGATEKAIVDEIGVEEADMEACEAKKLSKLEHGVHMSLRWKGKDENMRRRRLFNSI